MPQPNPYKLLGVPRDAGEAEIEEAYDSLYDEYEPAANAGDEEAVRMLEDLNRAFDTLRDPAKRAALDARMEAARGRSPSSGAVPGATGGGTAVKTRPQQRSGASVSTRVRDDRDSYPNRATTKRPRSVEPEPARPRLPLMVAAAVAVVVVLAGAIYLIAGNNDRGSQVQAGTGGTRYLDTPPSPDVVAEVNGAPIYKRDYEERVEKDKQNALSDPFFGAMVQNFEGITGTRMLDVISHDALDKLVNMEVIQQEAQKEGMYPNDADRQALIDQAKSVELGSRSFEEFLTQHNITEEQYNASVIRNAVYILMSSKHMPATGLGDERTNAFISWMCQARSNYDVKIYVKFTVQNDPCTSGLPSDLPIVPEEPAPPEEGIPGAEPTQAAPLSTP